MDVRADQLISMTAMTPFFTIIIPIFNVKDYLYKCLNSVRKAVIELNQGQHISNYKVVEIICIDDGSKDGSGIFLDQWSAANSDLDFMVVKVLHQENSGVSAARNIALDFASGLWIGFVDGDDFVDQYWLRGVANGISKHPDVTWVCTGHKSFYDVLNNYQVTEYVSSIERYIDFPHSQDYAWRYAAAVGLLCVHFFKRSSIGPIRFDPRIKVKEDTLFVLSVGLRMGGGFLELPYPSYTYRQRAKSASKVSAGTLSACTFQEGLNYLWSIKPGDKRSFAILTYKNLKNWVCGQSRNRSSERFRINQVLHESKKIGALRILSLPILTAIRFWLLLK